MKLSRTLLTLSTLAITVGLSSAAEAAEELGLSFELEPVQDSDLSRDQSVATGLPSDTATVTESADLKETDTPLPIPASAVNPPLAGDKTFPAGVYGGGQALALSNHGSQPNQLPAPPPAPKSAPGSATKLLASTTPTAQATSSQLAIEPQEPIDALLGFDLNPRTQDRPTVAATTAAATTHQNSNPAEMIAHVFRGGVESLVARAVGSAEGTRTPEGHKTPAYFGHIDPGNGVWNLGTFSYQHGAGTPEEADARQLSRLQLQSLALKRKAQTYNIDLSLEELLNGIDLANQAPMAALEREGYVEWLAEARHLGMVGTEAIIWARTRSFIDPDTQQWNAPGLGNNIHSISRDQSRRADAIAKAVSAKALPLPVAASHPSTGDTTKREESLAVAQESEDIGLRLDQALNQTLGALPTTASDETATSSEDNSPNDERNTQRLTAKPEDTQLPLEPETPTSPSTNPGQAIAPTKAAANQTNPIETEPSHSRAAAAPPDPSSSNNANAEAFTSDASQAQPESTVSAAFSQPKIDFPESSKPNTSQQSSLDPFPEPNVDIPSQS